MATFIPLTALLGGALIGLAAAALLLADGRIAGVSGIAAGIIARPNGDTSWRAAFLLGLLAGPPMFAALSGHWSPVHILASWPVIAAAGLLVGFGTRLGSGCTSGHGVCGLARFSPRSMASVVVFMAVAAATVFLVRHVIPGSGA